MVIFVCFRPHFSFLSGMILISLQYWYPQDAVSWYRVSTPFSNMSFTDHDKFGMEGGSAVWEQYLLSFYWVAATLTCNG